MKIQELLTEKKNKVDSGSAFSRIMAATKGEDPDFASNADEPKVAPASDAKQAPVNYDVPTAQRKGISIDQTPPTAAKSKGTVYTPTKPTGRQVGDIIKAGQNTLQWTGEPGKEWMIAGGPLNTPNPSTDRLNKIVNQNGKRYVTAADAKNLLSVGNEPQTTTKSTTQSVSKNTLPPQSITKKTTLPSQKSFDQVKPILDKLSAVDKKQLLSLLDKK